MGAGALEMVAFYAMNADAGGTAGPCAAGGLITGQYTFASTSAASTLSYPPTVGATIPATTGFTLYVHYLNTSSAALTAQLSLTMQVATAGSVTQHAGVLNLENSTFEVPAGQTVASADSYTLTQDVNVIASTSVLSRFATNFTATDGSQTLFSTTLWDAPGTTVYATPLALANGSVINWSCTDDNTLSETLTFGESAETNMRCLSISFIYPITDVNNPSIAPLSL
jgi:hypothetical protein